MREVCFKKSLLEITVLDEETEKEETFMFDAVFDKHDKQVDVFGDCEDLVVSALDGYNVTIFAYGQTGSGKTYTMAGTGKDPGVVPRAIHAIYKNIEENPQLEVTIVGKMVELYNNKVVDLLGDVKKQDKEGHKVRYDPQQNNVFLEPSPAERICVNSGQMSKMLQDGGEQRRTASTMMNSESSRSHLFTIMEVQCKDSITGRETKGKITLIDLAGSERLKKSHVTDAAQLEAIEINKSLTALGDVVSALTSGKSKKDVPYRNHKLTQMLQDSLGGTAKTVMFVNARPDGFNTDETLMSLKFAQRARNVINVKPTEGQAVAKPKPKTAVRR